MEQTDTASPASLPWNQAEFFSEKGFGEASDYFFRTHGKFAHMILDAHNAQGLSKTHIRWKLTKDIGDDYKMFIGSTIGAKRTNGNKTRGIRGELNHLLGTVYKKIAPTVPIENRVQQDLTIVTHPLGSLEVCYCLINYYLELGKRYASFAAGRRKVVRALVDEELFKWVWRLYYASVLISPEEATDYYEQIPSGGLNYIPLEKQRLTSPEKTLAIGKFLLGDFLAASHLRKPLCFFFVAFLRTTQYRLLPQLGRTRLEKIFELVSKYQESAGVDDIMLAIDLNINGKGSTQDSFEDLIEDEEKEVPKLVSPLEQGFVMAHQEFTSGKMAESLEKFLPKSSDSGDDQGEEQNSLMPIILVLRTQSAANARDILAKIPGPLLTMMQNRLRFGADDSVCMELSNRVTDVIEKKKESGETYQLIAKHRTDDRRKAPQAKPPPPDPAGSSGGDAAPGGQTAAPAAQPPPAQAEPRAEQAAESRQQSAAPAHPASSGLADKEIVIGWMGSGSGLTVQTLSPRQISLFLGMDSQCLAPWAVFALQTGQAGKGPAVKASQEAVQQVLGKLQGEIDADTPAKVSEGESSQLRDMSKMVPAHEYLSIIHQEIQGGAAHTLPAGPISRGIQRLTGRLGNDLEGFLRNPGQENYRDLLKELTNEEKYTATVLSRVARFSASL